LRKAASGGGTHTGEPPVVLRKSEGGKRKREKRDISLGKGKKKEGEGRARLGDPIQGAEGQRKGEGGPKFDVDFVHGKKGEKLRHHSNNWYEEKKKGRGGIAAKIRTRGEEKGGREKLPRYS